MRALAHQETPIGLRPRRPIVCGIDILGLVVTLSVLASYKPSPQVAILPIAIAAQYAVSCVYHWLPQHILRQKADHLMIVVLIGVTVVPYWSTLLSETEMLWRLSTLTILTASICTIRWFCFPWSKVGGWLYVMLGSFGLTISFYEFQEWLPLLGLVGFWLGIALYVVQFMVYTNEKPDPIPEVFGFREIQHVVLLCATTLQTVTALKYLS